MTEKVRSRKSSRDRDQSLLLTSVVDTSSSSSSSYNSSKQREQFEGTMASPRRPTTNNNSPSSHNNNNKMTYMDEENSNNNGKDIDRDNHDEDLKPLLIDSTASPTRQAQLLREIPMGNGIDAAAAGIGSFFTKTMSKNPEFYQQAMKFAMCFCGLQISYLTWGYMQELIMTTQFVPTPRVPKGMFPSAAFCVFSNRFLAVIVAMIAVKYKHGAIFANNVAPLWAFTPCALSNTMSSWSQYASLKYVSFPVQTVFKSSKIIPVMMMGKLLKGTSYPIGQYVEALLITVGVAIFSVASKTSEKDTQTEVIGLIFLLMYICFDSFTSQWQDKVYQQYGKKNVDPYQMMLGVNSSAICITTLGLIITGDLPIVWEFIKANPVVFRYNIITAITSASGQLCIFYTIKEFGPIVFTIIMTTRQMFSICISSIVFGHAISLIAFIGAALVFSVIFYQIRRKYYARMQRESSVSNGGGGGGSSGG